MLKRHLSVGCLLAVVAALPVTLSAQRPAGLRPTVFAIRDARVITEPGKVVAHATVVIRDGVIQDVGPDVPVPAGALVIEGQELRVYPGFVDALSNWGFDPALRRSETGAPAPEDFASEALAATKADNRKGLTPEFQVRNALRDEEQADSWRKLGFTAHLVAPDGGIVVGQSALVSLSGTRRARPSCVPPWPSTSPSARSPASTTRVPSWASSHTPGRPSWMPSITSGPGRRSRRLAAPDRVPRSTPPWPTWGPRYAATCR